MRAAAILFVAVAIMASRAVAQEGYQCAGIPTCEQCVSHQLCGWCSVDVVFPNGTTGGQCAGFEPGHSVPFQCNGIFSTEQCFAGYVCDESDFQCKLGAPGQGNTLQKCEENCTNDGQVYLCNLTSLKCYEVPRGTPGATSMAVCEASCAHPSPHPAPPVSPAPTSALYACNTTTGQCVKAPAGQGEALSVCQQECQKVNPDSYMCNTFLHTCEKMPPNVPGGESLAQCEAECNPKPTPGPPPQLNGAYFRGIQIQKGYATAVYDLEINNTIVTYVEEQGGKVVTSWTGTPGHFPNSNTIQMTITLTSGPNAGKIINTLTVFGTPGPETKHAAMAMSAPGDAMPTSITSSMTEGNGYTVYAFSECNSADCIFTLPALTKLRAAKHRHMHRASTGDVTDRCSEFAANCSYCLQHQFCGWCSVDVTYQNGEKGTQCAGFNNANGTGPAFKCNGRYSTFNCTQGYICNQTSMQCQITAPGNGMPLDVCTQFCHATPPPTPKQPMALCNLTTLQCLPCPDNATHCPGSLPLPACEAACSHHKKGPHANIIGIWRGMYIQNGYKRVEVDVVFDNTSATFIQAGESPMKCNVTSLGSDLMIFDIIAGTYKGWTFAGVFQKASQPGGLFSTMTLATGKLGGSSPSGFNEAMGTQGDSVYVLDKCDGSPCEFTNPIPTTRA